MESEKSGYSLTVQGFRGKWRGIQKMRKRNNKFVVLELEKNATQMKNHELSKTVDELQKVHESTLAQLTEGSRLAAEKIRSLESEAETLISKKKDAEVLIFKLEEKVEFMLESSRSPENQVV